MVRRIQLLVPRKNISSPSTSSLIRNLGTKGDYREAAFLGPGKRRDSKEIPDVQLSVQLASK